MSRNLEFLADEAGQLQEQRYRITQAIADEATRRQAFGSIAAAARAAGGGRPGPRRPHSMPTQHADGTVGSPSRLNPRPRTKLEQAMLDRVPARQQAGLTKPQVVQGAVYDGPGYSAAPSLVRFDDFVVGETYRAQVTLTNVSRSFNSFKVKPLSTEVLDCLSVAYDPASMMSAGLSTKLTVTFAPKSDADIDTEIPILCQTGPIAVPVVCRRRRTDIKVSTRCVDFGSVVVAEAVTRRLTVRNTGALPTRLEVTGDIADALRHGTHALPSGRPHPYLRLDPPLDELASVPLPPGGSLTLSLQYTPFDPQGAALDTTLYLAFTAEGVHDIPVIVKGSPAPVPVFIARNAVLDMRVCDSSTLYREKFAVLNTTGAAVNVQPEVPAVLRGMLDFVPKHGFAQPGTDPVEFQVKFRPRIDALAARLPPALLATPGATAATPLPIPAVASTPTPDDTAATAAPQSTAGRATPSLAAPSDASATAAPTAQTPDLEGTVAEVTAQDMAPPVEGAVTAAEGGAVEVPIKVVVAGQAMPVFVTLRATMTPRVLECIPPTLFAGTLTPGEALELPLRLRNVSRLCRCLGVLRPPANIRVAPPTDLVRLTPGEEIACTVAVRPPPGTSGRFRQTLSWLTQEGDRVDVAVTGKVRACPLRFDRGVVKLPACATGDALSAQVTIVNTGAAPQRFAFQPLLRRYGISVTPRAGELAPGRSLPVTVSFDAHPMLLEDPLLDDAGPLSDETDSRSGTPADLLERSRAQPKAKKKTKAEEEAERKERERAALAEQARQEAYAAARAALEAEVGTMVPWEASVAGAVPIRPTDIDPAAGDSEEPTPRAPGPTALHAGMSYAPPTDAALRTADHGRGDSPQLGCLAEALPDFDLRDPAGAAPETEPWSRHRTVHIPCDVEGWAGGAIFLDVRTTVVPAVVTASLPKHRGQGPAEDRLVATDFCGTGEVHKVGLRVPFGAVPAMGSAVRTVVLKNRSKLHTVCLAARAMDPFGPFQLVKPPAPMGPGQFCEVAVRFTPATPATYTERLVFAAAGQHDVTLVLSGQGLPTALKVSLRRPVPEASPPPQGKKGAAAPPAPKAEEEPEEYVDHGVPSVAVPFGCSLTGDAATQPLYFTNQSSFALHVSIAFDDDAALPSNADGAAPFHIAPAAFSLKAGASFECAAVFAPTAAGEFTARATVEFGGSSARKRLVLSGTASARGLYLQLPPEATPRPTTAADMAHTPAPLFVARRDPFAPAGPAGPAAAHGDGAVLPFTSETLGAPPLPELQGETTVDRRAKKERTVEIVEEHPVARPVAHVLHVGAVRGSTGGECVVEGLSDADIRAGWRVDPPRAALQAGSRVPVTLTFAPTAALLDTLPLPGIDVVSSADVRVTLRGGAPHTDTTQRIWLKGVVRRT